MYFILPALLPIGAGQKAIFEFAMVTIRPTRPAMNFLSRWQVSRLYPIINECLTEASIIHDEFQINQAIWSHFMLHGFHLQIGNRTCHSGEGNKKPAQWPANLHKKKPALGGSLSDYLRFIRRSVYPVRHNSLNIHIVERLAFDGLTVLRNEH